MKGERPRLSESALLAALRRRYPAPEFAFIGGVRNSTGFSGTVRTADAVAMSLWRSRGLHLYGFELKSYRGDWLREKKDPAKADEIAAFCSFWWIVAGGDEIVEPSELPGSWGLMVPTKTGTLRTVVAAKLLEDPKPVTRGFLAAILRRAQEESPATVEIKEAVDKAREEERQSWVNAREKTKDRWESELEALRQTVSEFESRSGIRIVDRWHIGDVGDAVKILMHGGLLNREHEVRKIAERLSELSGSLVETLNAMKKIRGADGVAAPVEPESPGAAI